MKPACSKCAILLEDDEPGLCGYCLCDQRNAVRTDRLGRMTEDILRLIHTETLVHRCHQEAEQRGLDYVQMLELMVKALAAWRAQSTAREVDRVRRGETYDKIYGNPTWTNETK